VHSLGEQLETGIDKAILFHRQSMFVRIRTMTY
jgi:hypothetical protein